MKKSLIKAALLAGALLTCTGIAMPREAQAGGLKGIVLYIPNRVFDLLDIVRLRVRVGPGISAGVRATKFASAFAGGHSSVFAGLPGPRGSAKLPLPVGFEVRGGVQVSLIDLSDSKTYYDPLEIGLEVQPVIVGCNIGIGVLELLDFATGIFMIDLQDDDF
jgi:hypothetical protein